MSSLMEKSKLKAAFGSAETTEQMLKAFHQMEMSESCDETDIGLASIIFGFHLISVEDFDKALTFAIRAFKSLKVLDAETNTNNPSLPVSNALNLMGCVHFGLRRFSDSLHYLNRAYTMLLRLHHEGGLSLEENWFIFQDLNLQLAQAHDAAENHKEALPFCLKAVELREKWMGPYSLEVADDRKLLGRIYSGLGEHEKALEQNVLVKRIVVNRDDDKSNVLRVELDSAIIMIALGRYDEAVQTLKNVVEQMDEDNENRPLALIFMAKAFGNQEKFEDCKRYLDTSLGILAKREQIYPVEVAVAYAMIWKLYETMKDFEAAISLLKRTLALLEKLPNEQCQQGHVSGTLGRLLWQTDKYQEAIPYLESAAERFKYCYGPKHSKVAGVYNNLGAVYVSLDRPQLAAEMLAKAKDIYDVSVDPNHADRIAACHNLSAAYDEMGSYGLAIEFQQLVVNARESQGASAEDEFREACKFLEELKKKASDASANESPVEDLP